jgi:DNA primase
VIVVADADEAGIAAAVTALGKFRAESREVRVIKPRGAKDVAELAERRAS